MTIIFKICNDKNFQIVIPEKTTIETVDVSDYINPNGHNFTEYQKLCCIVDLLRSHESYLELFRKFRDSLIKAIKEERNSNLIWENDVKRVYIDDNDYICDILEIYENDNEDVIVSKFKEILFDPNHYITYHECDDDDDYDGTDDYYEWDL